jgi:hypothetical protein
MRVPTYLSLIILIFFCSSTLFANTNDPISEKTKAMKSFSGYFDFYWDDQEGKIWLEIDKLDTEFLYVNSLPAGIGSNDIGLDRGQLGRDRVVKFFRSGNKVLLTHVNYKYRAESDNPDERKSVEEAFAQSVLWGFKVEIKHENRVLVDATDFFMRDAHNVIQKLKQTDQGTYKLESSRSAIYLPRTKSFPNNTEFEAILTFKGEPKGKWIKSVTPSPEAVTVRQHHSFIKLPDDDYKPRLFDPRSGFNNISFQDYATPIGTPLTRRFINRHRLEKKNPNAERSEAVEPIVYYLDRGAPEPVKSALMEGAKWWNQAFEAAGYINAFQVKELPPEADPMDVRYNLIQWVHRSTRGWSYGSSVSDPRTGEIIKGHVSLGSLRVRQDFMIAQGLIPAYEKDGFTPDPKLLEMALARLRQLSAHEVGHTIGLAHNFAASVNNRSSVMDYPHPYFTLDTDGNINFEKAYDDKIGEWDKRTILYGYQDFPEGIDEETSLKSILKENISMGLHYISDRDARPPHGAHPYGHLWDNGNTPMEDLERLKSIRAMALNNFGINNIPKGAPMADLERVLVPLYLMHRYQVEAVSKLIGGVNYTYAMNGDGQTTNEPIDDETQTNAVQALLSTLDSDFLKLPENIINLIAPQPIGYDRDRELFKTYTGLTFDPLAAAESSINNTLKFLLNPQRLARLEEQYARSKGKRTLNTQQLIELLYSKILGNITKDPMQIEIERIIERLTIQHLLALASNRQINQQVAAIARQEVYDVEWQFESMISKKDLDWEMKSHYNYILNEIKLFKEHKMNFQLPTIPKMPEGSPIGCGHQHWTN